MLVLWPLIPAWAQVLTPNEAGVAVGSWHTIVRDVEATKKFWGLLGGTPIKVDGTEGMKFPGVLVFLAPGSASGTNKGTGMDHPGFNVRNGDDLMAKMKAAGVKVEP